MLGRDLAAAKPYGPFWLILDSLGGSALSAALGMLQPNGTCVVFGVSAASTATIESREFFATGGTRLYGLTLFHELMSVERAGIGLRLLAELIAADKIAAAGRSGGAVGRDRRDRAATDRPRLHWQGGIAHLSGHAVVA